MKILITTQTVNKNDPILGFFHTWILEFAKNYDQVSVICLYEGVHDLPDNVRVYSLGKEQGISRLKYIKNFFKYIWMLRKKYDSVFVHMNEEHVLLGGVIWKLLGKKVVMWRNHKSGSWKTKIAGLLSDKVCYTSSGSYTANFKNAVQMPVGIDQKLFQSIENVTRKNNSFLYIGRISPIKNIENMVDGFILFHQENPETEFSFDLVGPATAGDEKYKRDLVYKIQKNNLSSKINFYDAVPQLKLPEIYSAYQFCINLTESGSFDKTIWESVFCGCIPMVHNKSFIEEVPGKLRDFINIKKIYASDFAGAVKKILAQDVFLIANDLMQIGQKHKLQTVIEKIKALFDDEQGEYLTK